ncbi:MAG: hypothetical protein IJI11_00055 [Mogibacterium sp.]|nr:hypothetical protein [Mogibacterium sp.]
MQRKVFTEAERTKIARLHFDEKRTMKSLAEKFDDSVSTVSRWVIRYRNSVKTTGGLYEFE